MANPEHVKILNQGVAAWNKWRQENPAVVPDLGGEFFVQRELSGADLSGTNLKMTNYNHANLSGTNLRSTRIGRAIFVNTNLSKADFGSAGAVSTTFLASDLRGALFDKTNLHSSQFKDTNLSGADFSTCIIGGCSFANVDLSEIKGLATTKHVGPSSIGIDTLFRSKGVIPDAFLRGCGVSEELIRHLPSFLNQPIEFYSCFISYSHADKAFARRLHDALQGRGIRCWLDEHQLLPGDQIHRAVDEAVRLWDKVLLCCSEASLQSWWVDKEIQKALMKGTTLEGARPGNAGHHPAEPGRPSLLARMEGEEGLEGAASHVASSRRFHRLGKDNAKFESQFERVVKALRADGAAREQAPSPKL